MIPRFARAGAAAAILAACLPGRAGAAPTPAPTVPPDVPSRLALVAQDPWTILGGTFRARLAVAASTPGEQLNVVAHDALSARSSFDSQDLGPVLKTLTLPVDLLPTEADGSRDVAIGVSGPNGAFDASRLAVPQRGVYPLEIELRDSQEQGLARFVTYLVAVDAGLGGQPQPLTTRLGVAWVWPLAARPALQPDGSIAPAVTTALQPEGILGRQVAALARHPSVPVTLAPSPETLDTWSTLARVDPGAGAGASELRGAVDTGQVQALAGPYVPVDLPALLRGGLGSADDAAVLLGAAATDRFFGSRLDQRTVLAVPVDADSLTRLRARGVDQVIVDGRAVTPGRSPLTSAAPFGLEPSASLAPSGPVAAVANDDGLAGTLGGSSPPALRAQRFLAGLALTAIEAPASTRAVVVVNPDGFDASAALLEAVLGGLTGNPWLTPTTVRSVFSGVPPATIGDVRSLTPYTPGTPAVSDRSYRAAQAHLTAFGSLVPASDPRLARGGRFLLSSISSAWPPPPAGPALARGALAAANATVNAFIAQIRVPAPGTITLTARSGAVPITFRNDTGQAVRVLVGLSSHKLDFPGGALQLVALPPRSTTIRFDVRSRTSGTFPLVMSVRSADGSLLIAEGRFKVRSTVISSVGLALAIGAAVFIVAWWAFDIRRRRRARLETVR
ncbi:MAG TPA: DUF6049 family protein [Acidimicrobiia bacterium]|nr:DUF6049 family protein [Acidimicrobiia bacterium]